MSKTFRYDPDESGSSRTEFRKSNKRNKRRIKEDKRAAARRDSDVEGDGDAVHA